jgi:uncharacterized NAD-dependent epimerase/dehydratase family protein
MLQENHKVAIYLEGHFSTDYGKMGIGVLRYLSNTIVAVIDSKNNGKNTNEFNSIERSVPIVEQPRCCYLKWCRSSYIRYCSLWW